MFICSSNDQNFISHYSNQDNKYLIRKLDYKLQSTSIDYNRYNYSISNHKLSLNINKTFNNVYDISKQYNCTLREASYIKSIQKLENTYLSRGLV